MISENDIEGFTPEQNESKPEDGQFGTASDKSTVEGGFEDDAPAFGGKTVATYEVLKAQLDR